MASNDTQSSWNPRTLQRSALTVGGVGLTLCAVGALFDLDQFLASYLVAFMFWLGIALGSVVLGMIHNLTGGVWGLALRPWLEAGSRTLPLLLLLFVPIALGVTRLYPWARPEEHHEPALMEKMELYLNVPFFLVRAGIYFAVWLVVSFLLNRWAGAAERDRNPALVRRAQGLSGPGLVLFGLTITFAAIDWIMSLEPEWYSAIFGVLIGTGQVLSALALAIAGLAWSSVCGLAMPAGDASAKPQAGDTWNDLGNLLLAFVMLWTYMSFSQLLLIWSGNLPEEITWYVHRTRGGWDLVGLLLALFYFAVPFVFLLSRAVKRDAPSLGKLALLLVAMGYVHQWWLIAPAGSPEHLYVHWLDPAAAVGVGGIWLGVCIRNMPQSPAPASAVLQGAPQPQQEVSHA